jgi:hypothetical protein
MAAHVPQCAGVLRVNSPLRRFVLSALLWLPACFFLWFVVDGVVVWPAAQIASHVLPALLPNVIAEVVQLGAELEIETRLLTPAGAEGQLGALVLQIRPLIYAWCLPLFAGLVMASPLSGGQRSLHLAIGLPVLWLVVAWGTIFDVLKLLAFDAGPLGAAAVTQAGFGGDAVALGYQFGYLILPPVVPVALWVVLNREFLEELVGWDREPNMPAAGPIQPGAPVASESATLVPSDPAPTAGAVEPVTAPTAADREPKP